MIILILRCDWDGGRFSPPAGEDQVPLDWEEGTSGLAGPLSQSSWVWFRETGPWRWPLPPHQPSIMGQTTRGLLTAGGHRAAAAPCSQGSLLVSPHCHLPQAASHRSVSITVRNCENLDDWTESSCLWPGVCLSLGALGNLMRSYWIYLKTGEGAVILDLFKKQEREISGSSRSLENVIQTGTDQ